MQDGSKSGWTARILLIVIGVGIIAAVVLSGGAQSETFYLLVTGLAFFLILLAILWQYRSDITGMLITILLLLVLFFITAFICGSMGIGSNWRLGIITIMFIITYAWWIDFQKIKLNWWKFGIFIFLLVLFYATGLLPSLNDIADKAFGFVKGM